MTVSTFPVVEVFGPVVQGEGPMAGSLTHFVRFGGCGYRCEWCDSLYAVLPEEWKDAPRLDAGEITNDVNALEDAPWVTLSGGNPAMYQLGELVERLHACGYRVAVETQGDTWRPWLAEVDSLVLSPKPPSSGMVTDVNLRKWQRFLDSCYRAVRSGYVTAIKIVVFDTTDYEWAIQFLRDVPDRGWPFYLSVGTPPPDDDIEDVRLEVCDRWTWLCDTVIADRRAARLGVRLLPQLHVLAYQHARGV